MQALTIQEILFCYRNRIDSLDVELIIANVISRTREFILTHPEYEVTKSQRKKIESLLKRRLDHEPLAHILGHREFFGLDFKITKDTLIPRPETELMVEEILRHEHDSAEKAHCVVDVGTGSGCIIISITKELLKSKLTETSYTFYGTDISPQALGIAKENAQAHTLEKHVSFIQSDLLEGISQKIIDAPHIDSLIIAANLPYLSHAIYASSMPDVQNFEPQSALLSEEDGLSHYRRLLEQIQIVRTQKKPAGIQLFFEISPEQKTSIKKLIRAHFPQARIEIKEDLAGKPRLAIAKV